MKQKLNAKDFILIGVLTALMWIICMIISTIMSVAGPVTNVFYPSVVAIPNGIVMMLLLAKVPKKGVFTICSAIQAILFLLVGAFWFIPIGLVIGGVICDFLVMGRKEITMKSMTVAYALFSAIFAFSAICPIKFLQSAFVGAMEKNNIAQEYIDGMLNITSVPMLVVIVAAGLVGGLIGFLKYRFNINEVVSSIMLNYTFQYVISFFINTFFVDPVSRQSKEISAASRLTLMDTMVGNLKMDIPLGIILALLTVVAVWFLLEKTKLGYELKAVGYSRSAAKYAGIKVGRSMVLSMMISGALAGLAGVTYYLGYVGSIQPKVLISTGFDAIAVSLLGNNNPFGIVFSTMLITLISKGSTYMKSAAGVDAEIASVITGIILLFSACNAYIKWKMERGRREKTNKTKEDK